MKCTITIDMNTAKNFQSQIKKLQKELDGLGRQRGVVGKFQDKKDELAALNKEYSRFMDYAMSQGNG